MRNEPTLGDLMTDEAIAKIEAFSTAIEAASREAEQALKAAAPDEWAAYEETSKLLDQGPEVYFREWMATKAELMKAAPDELAEYEKARTQAWLEFDDSPTMQRLKAASEIYDLALALLKEKAPKEFETWDAANKTLSAEKAALYAPAPKKWKAYFNAKDDDTRMTAENALKAAAPEQFESFAAAQKAHQSTCEALRAAAPKEFAMAAKANDSREAAQEVHYKRGLRTLEQM